MKSMLMVVTAAAVTCFCLVYPHPLLGDLYYTLALLAIGFAVLAAVLLRKDLRAFWIGFALFATGYAWLTFSGQLSALDVSAYQRTGTWSRPRIITTQMLDALFDEFAMKSLPAQAMRFPAPGFATGVQSTILRQLDPNYVAFASTGHAVFALLAGWLGGYVARRLYQRQLLSG
jgi:hypothetical protein